MRKAGQALKKPVDLSAQRGQAMKRHNAVLSEQQHRFTSVWFLLIVIQPAMWPGRPCEGTLCANHRVPK